MSALGPWEPADPNDSMCRRAAIKRGLVACGFLAEDDARIGKWPTWAFSVYLALPDGLELAGVRMLAEGSEEARRAVEAAYALGGNQAVYAVVIRSLRARLRFGAQEEFAGELDRPKETA